MGGQYQRQIEVSPNDTLDSVRNKVPFFSLFAQRNYTLVTDGGDKIEGGQFTSLLFRDSGLRNGSRLFMRPPARERDERAQNEMDVEGDEGGIMRYWEGGEDEMEEMFEGGED